MNKKSMLITMILFALLFSIIPSGGYAQESILKLEYVIVKMDDNSMVRVTMGDYGRAFSSASSGNPNLLWNTLRGSQSKPLLQGVGSGDKYITMGEYGRKYSGMVTKNSRENLGLKASQITSEALMNSQPIDSGIVDSYKQIVFIKDITGKIIDIEFEPIKAIQEFKVLDIY